MHFTLATAAMAESTNFRSSQDLPAYFVERRRRGCPVGSNYRTHSLVALCTFFVLRFLHSLCNVCPWGSFNMAAAHYVQSRS